MGKRSEFERVEKDFYRTIDQRAVAALLPFLEPETSFCEPCFGQGDLAESLQSAGHEMTWCCDIASEDSEIMKADATSFKYENGMDFDYFITNPPWTRKLLHPIISNLSKQAPTWLLFDSDWAFTKQSAPYMKELCTDIIAIGRLIWIPGTKMSGKDNCSWYRFSVDKNEPTRFYGR